MNTNKKQIAFFERYLSLWVALCIACGSRHRSFCRGYDGHIGENGNLQCQHSDRHFDLVDDLPDDAADRFWIGQKRGQSSQRSHVDPRYQLAGQALHDGFFAWIFFDKLYSAYIEPEMAGEYIAGAILLGVAPCTAMVFVWSYLTDGDPNYTLVQVSVNDLIILVAFVPLVGLLLGITNVTIPYETLVASVAIFVVIPLVAGVFTNKYLIRQKGEDWFKNEFLPKFKPVSIIALLFTLVLLFAFQGPNILNNPLIIVLIAVPLIIQTYFIFFLAWYGGRKLKLAHPICAPAAMIGASNFFELAVAVAIALFGLESPAALVTVVGVLVEVPVMLSLVALANKWKY
jgi:arsenite transporter